MTLQDRDPDKPLGSAAGLCLLVEALAPVTPPRAVRKRLLADLTGPERWTPWAAEAAGHFGLDARDLREALRRMPDPSAWQAGPWPGSRLLTTPPLMKATTVIARLAAGTQIASHRHAARELTYVLDGSLSASGQVHESGGLMDMPPGSVHEVSVSGGSDCLVLFAISSR